MFDNIATTTAEITKAAIVLLCLTSLKLHEANKFELFL